MGYAYRDDGQVNTVTLDGATVATVAYDTYGEVSGVTYPFGGVGTFMKYPSGSLKGDTWSVSASSRTFTELVTRLAIPDWLTIGLNATLPNRHYGSITMRACRPRLIHRSRFAVSRLAV